MAQNCSGKQKHLTEIMSTLRGYYIPESFNMPQVVEQKWNCDTRIWKNPDKENQEKQVTM